MGGLLAFWMAAMDLIGRGIKARREYRHLHRYLRVAAEAREPRSSCDSAVPDQMASPETGGPVAAGSFADVGESPVPLRVAAAPGLRLTCALGILLSKMSNRAVSLARVTAVQGGDHDDPVIYRAGVRVGG